MARHILTASKIDMQNIQYRSSGAAPEQRQCFKCNYEAVSPLTACPRCRCTKFLTAGSIRTRGVVMLCLGLFLALFITAIMLVAGILLYGAADTNPETARKLNSEAHILLAAVLLLGSLIAFGFHGIVSGFWMIIFGKRNRVLLWLMWALLFIIGIFAVGIRLLID